MSEEEEREIVEIYSAGDISEDEFTKITARAIELRNEGMFKKDPWRCCVQSFLEWINEMNGVSREEFYARDDLEDVTVH